MNLIRLFIKVGRVQFLILTLIIVGFSTLGQQFIALWAGENYEYAFWIALLLMLAPYVPPYAKYWSRNSKGKESS